MLVGGVQTFGLEIYMFFCYTTLGGGVKGRLARGGPRDGPGGEVEGEGEGRRFGGVGELKRWPHPKVV